MALNLKDTFDPKEAFDPAVFRNVMRCAAVGSVAVCLLALLILNDLDPAAHGAACIKGSTDAWNSLVISGAAALWMCFAALRWRHFANELQKTADKGERPNIYGAGKPIPTSFTLFFLVFGTAWTLFCAIPLFVIAANCIHFV